MTIIIPDTALCAIVRDEIMNPAGGIIDFIDSTVPFVEEAIVVDALSKDGTREALEELQAKHPHLKVFDKSFTGYADQRNYSLEQTTAKRALVLDADERLTKQDFANLRERVIDQPSRGYHFRFLDVTPENPNGTRGSGHHIRLFDRDNAGYRSNPGECWEFPCFDGEPARWHDAFNLGISIKHFRPSFRNRKLKMDLWYKGAIKEGFDSEISPHDIPESKVWKAYNSARERYR